MPKTLTVPDLPYPLWVEASLLTADAEANVALLGPSANRLREILSSPEENGCHAVGPVYFHVAYPEPRENLRDSVVHSRTNVLGRITGKSYGFYGGIPGQLFRVTPLRTFGDSVSQQLYFFVPVGRFEVAGEEICKVDPAYAAPPERGGEVFLFLNRSTHNSFFNVMAEDVVPVNAKGALVLPARYAAGAHPSVKADLLKEIAHEKVERKAR